jgi:carboxymethylenebutenolidase
MSDDKTQPDAKDKLKEAFIAANNPAEIEVYQTCYHGWCVPDMPKQGDGTATYNKAEADRAWGKLLGLYKGSLA